VPWWCPVCHGDLELIDGGQRWQCPDRHSFDVARQGYVNLLRRGSRRRAPGDSREMVTARRAFLATGAYQRVSDRFNDVVARLVEAHAAAHVGWTALDVGCGEGYYTRRLAGALVGDTPAGGADDLDIVLAGIDVAQPAVAAAARQHRAGDYAVASAYDVPLPPASVDGVLSVFGPIAPEEFERVLRPSGVVVAAHPGPSHLLALRELVYADPRPHEVKDPLRSSAGFSRTSSMQVSYPLRLETAEAARQLLTMTPYRWHAPPDIDARLDAAGALWVDVDVIISTYSRQLTAPGRDRPSAQEGP
jgi:23S rRNA (guanine745-N1)-methyltransferase